MSTKKKKKGAQAKWEKGTDHPKMYRQVAQNSRDSIRAANIWKEVRLMKDEQDK